MPGIFIMGIIVLVSGLVLALIIFKLLAGRVRPYLLPLALGLPLSALVNILIKAPLANGVANLSGLSPAFTPLTPWWFIIFLWLLSPVTEELIKILPLFIPRLRTILASPRQALWGGAALGIGFGLGEAAFLAISIGNQPQYAALPWNMYWPFAIERLQTVILHGVMTAVVVRGLQHGRVGIPLGLLGGMALHALINSVAVAYQLGAMPVDVLQWWVSGALLVCVLLFGLMMVKASEKKVDNANLSQGGDGE